MSLTRIDFTSSPTKPLPGMDDNQSQSGSNSNSRASRISPESINSPTNRSAFILPAMNTSPNFSTGSGSSANGYNNPRTTQHRIFTSTMLEDSRSHKLPLTGIVHATNVTDAYLGEPNMKPNAFGHESFFSRQSGKPKKKGGYPPSSRNSPPSLHLNPQKENKDETAKLACRTEPHPDKDVFMTPSTSGTQLLTPSKKTETEGPGRFVTFSPKIQTSEAPSIDFNEGDETIASEDNEITVIEGNSSDNNNATLTADLSSSVSVIYVNPSKPKEHHPLSEVSSGVSVFTTESRIEEPFLPTQDLYIHNILKKAEKDVQPKLDNRKQPVSNPQPQKREVEKYETSGLGGIANMLNNAIGFLMNPSKGGAGESSQKDIVTLKGPENLLDSFTEMGAEVPRKVTNDEQPRDEKIIAPIVKDESKSAATSPTRSKSISFNLNSTIIEPSSTTQLNVLCDDNTAAEPESPEAELFDAGSVGTGSEADNEESSTPPSNSDYVETIHLLTESKSSPINITRVTSSRTLIRRSVEKWSNNSLQDEESAPSTLCHQQAFEGQTFGDPVKVKFPASLGEINKLVLGNGEDPELESPSKITCHFQIVPPAMETVEITTITKISPISTPTSSKNKLKSVMQHSEVNRQNKMTVDDAVAVWEGARCLAYQNTHNLTPIDTRVTVKSTVEKSKSQSDKNIQAYIPHPDDLIHDYMMRHRRRSKSTKKSCVKGNNIQVQSHSAGQKQRPATSGSGYGQYSSKKNTAPKKRKDMSNENDNLVHSLLRLHELQLRKTLECHFHAGTGIHLDRPQSSPGSLEYSGNELNGYKNTKTSTIQTDSSPSSPTTGWEIFSGRPKTASEMNLYTNKSAKTTELPKIPEEQPTNQQSSLERSNLTLIRPSLKTSPKLKPFYLTKNNDLIAMKKSKSKSKASKKKEKKEKKEKNEKKEKKMKPTVIQQEFYPSSFRPCTAQRLSTPKWSAVDEDFNDFQFYRNDSINRYKPRPSSAKLQKHAKRLIKSAVTMAGTQTPQDKERLLTPTHVRKQLKKSTISRPSTTGKLHNPKGLPLIQKPKLPAMTQTSKMRNNFPNSHSSEKEKHGKNFIVGGDLPFNNNNEMETASKASKRRISAKVRFMETKPKPSRSKSAGNYHKSAGFAGAPTNSSPQLALQEQIKLKKVKVTSTKSADRIGLSYKRRRSPKVSALEISKVKEDKEEVTNNQELADEKSHGEIEIANKGFITFSNIAMLAPTSPHLDKDFIDLNIIVRRRNAQGSFPRLEEIVSDISSENFYLILDETSSNKLAPESADKNISISTDDEQAEQLDEHQSAKSDFISFLLLSSASFETSENFEIRKFAEIPLANLNLVKDCLPTFTQETDNEEEAENVEEALNAYDFETTFGDQAKNYPEVVAKNEPKTRKTKRERSGSRSPATCKISSKVLHVMYSANSEDIDTTCLHALTSSKESDGSSASLFDVDSFKTVESESEDEAVDAEVIINLGHHSRKSVTFNVIEKVVYSETELLSTDIQPQMDEEPAQNVLTPTVLDENISTHEEATQSDQKQDSATSSEMMPQAIPLLHFCSASETLGGCKKCAEIHLANLKLAEDSLPTFPEEDDDEDYEDVKDDDEAKKYDGVKNKSKSRKTKREGSRSSQRSPSAKRSSKVLNLMCSSYSEDIDTSCLHALTSNTKESDESTNESSIDLGSLDSLNSSLSNEILEADALESEYERQDWEEEPDTTIYISHLSSLDRL